MEPACIVLDALSFFFLYSGFLTVAGSVRWLSEDVSSPSFFVILMHLFLHLANCLLRDSTVACGHPLVVAYAFNWGYLLPPPHPFPSLLYSELNSSSLHLQLSLRETAQIKVLSPMSCFILVWDSRATSFYPSSTRFSFLSRVNSYKPYSSTVKHNSLGLEAPTNCRCA